MNLSGFADEYKSPIRLLLFRLNPPGEKSSGLLPNNIFHANTIIPEFDDVKFER